MKSLFVLFALLLSLTIETKAEYVQTCNVKYKTGYSWSKYYTVTTYFYTGRELNKATRSFDFDTTNVYAVIWWSDDECSVIKITTPVSCWIEATQSCIRRMPSNIEGEDQDGRQWTICLGKFCY